MIGLKVIFSWSVVKHFPCMSWSWRKKVDLPDCAGPKRSKETLLPWDSLPPPPRPDLPLICRLSYRNENSFNGLSKSTFCQIGLPMVFENHRKSLIQHCERSELRLHFDPFWRVFEKLKLAVKQCYQTGQF